MRACSVLLVLPALAVGCVPDGGLGEGATGDWGYLDYTLDVPDPDDGDYQIATPIVEVPPYTEARTCNFETYEGPDRGIVAALDFYDRTITHHTALLDVHDDRYADGEIVNCELMGSAAMDVYGLFFEGGGPELTEDFEPPGPEWDVSYWTDEVARVSMVGLPDGVAFPLRTGQRLAIDFHMLNPFDQPVHTNAAYNMELVPTEEVEMWAGAGMLDSAPFTLPPGRTGLSFDCPFDSTVNVVNIQPHMHDYGLEYVVDIVRADGSVENVLYEPEWTPSMKTEAPFYHYPQGEITLHAGDAIRTTCSWDNPTGEPLPYPVEMCTTSFVGFPMEEGMTCFGDVTPEPLERR